MTAGRWSLAICVPMTLACGGLVGATVDPGAHMQRVCREVPFVALPADLQLPARSAPPVRMSDPMPLGILIRAGEVQIDGVLSDDPGTAIQAAVERVGTDALPAVFIDVGTPVLEVGAALGMLHRAGLRRMLVVSASDEPRRLPPPPRAELADELRASLPDEPGSRSAAAGERLLEAVADCPAAAAAVAEVVAADPDSCATLAETLGEALPTCLLTDVDAVVTIAQVMFEPPGPNAFTATIISLDPSAPLLEADADTVWGDHTERLRTPLWMAGAASEEQLQESCDTGQADACWELGHRLQQADSDRARFLWRVACEHDHRDSCGDLAQLLGAEADDQQGLEAIEVANLACELESGLGCSLLGAWTRDGAFGLEADAEAAATWLKKACDLGHDEACD